MNDPTTWPAFLAGHHALSLTAAVVAVTVLIVGVLALRRAGRAVAARLARVDRADLLTYLAASIATAVAAQGMWRFFRDVLHVEAFLRVGMFAFIEIAVLASAVRARRTIREQTDTHPGGRASAGIDGAAVWALTGLSACLSAMHAASFPEAVFRLAAPLVAAWLWERGLHVEVRARTGRTGIHWSLTLERVMVRTGLAEPSGRTTGQVATERHLTRLALAVKRARALQDTGTTGRRHRRALARLDAAMRRAITHTALATDPAQQQILLAQLAALTNARTLLTLTQPSPWRISPSVSATIQTTGPDPVTGSDRDPQRVTGPDRVTEPAAVTGLDRVNDSAPVTGPDPVTGQDRITDADPVRDPQRRRVVARPGDVARIRAAIASGHLPHHPSVREICKHLAIGPAYASAARSALTTRNPTPERAARQDPLSSPSLAIGAAQNHEARPVQPPHPEQETETPEHLLEEAISAVTNNPDPDTQPITEGMSPEKGEETHTYAVDLT